MNMFREFFKYVSLNVLGMIGMSCYILADTFFVANGLGPDGLAALNLALPAYSLIFGMGLMFGMGAASRFSISGQEKEVGNRVFTHALLLALAASVLFVICGLFFAEPFSRLLGASGTTLTMTKTYLRIVLIFSPAFLCNNVLTAFVRNDGGPRLAMLGMIVGSLSNILLDYLFIFPLGLGMAGAALATGAAPVISMVFLSAHFRKKKNHFQLVKTPFRFRTAADICALGAGSLLTELSSGFVMFLFNLLILRIQGTLGVAAYGIIVNIALVLISVFTGTAQGIQPLVSKSAGSGAFSDMKKIFRYAVVFAVAFSLLVYACMLFFAEPVAGFFNSEKNLELTNLASRGIRFYFSGLLFTGFNCISAVFFSSADEPRKAFTISLLKGFLVIVPVAMAAAAAFGMDGIWLAVPFTELTVSVYACFSTRRFFCRKQ